jgi:hypothetical protein
MQQYGGVPCEGGQVEQNLNLISIPLEKPVGEFSIISSEVKRREAGP